MQRKEIWTLSLTEVIKLCFVVTAGGNTVRTSSVMMNVGLVSEKSILLTDNLDVVGTILTLYFGSDLF